MIDKTSKTRLVGSHEKRGTGETYVGHQRLLSGKTCHLSVSGGREWREPEIEHMNFVAVVRRTMSFLVNYHSFIIIHSLSFIIIHYYFETGTCTAFVHNMQLRNVPLDVTRRCLNKEWQKEARRLNRFFWFLFGI